MSVRDFALLLATCAIWGFNFVVTKWMVTGQPWTVAGFDGAPPFFFASLPMGVIALALGVFLWPRPKQLARVIAAALCMGAANFGFFFIGMLEASPSTAAVVLQTQAPFATLLAITFLSERVGWRRWSGMALTFLGVALLAFDPDGFRLSPGLLWIAASAFSTALGSILMKRLGGMGPLQLQAWVGVVCVFPMVGMSLLFENDQIPQILTGGWAFFAGLAFTIVLVAMFGHSIYFMMLKKYDVSIVATLTLMAPAFGMVFGVWVAGDSLTARFLIGAGLVLTGALMMARRAGRSKAQPALPPEPVFRPGGPG
ncbi:MAG: DMT family transporter [Maricaulaceae bacterium]